MYECKLVFDQDVCSAETCCCRPNQEVSESGVFIELKNPHVWRPKETSPLCRIRRHRRPIRREEKVKTSTQTSPWQRVDVSGKYCGTTTCTCVCVCVCVCERDGGGGSTCSHWAAARLEISQQHQAWNQVCTELALPADVPCPRLQPQKRAECTTWDLNKKLTAAAASQKQLSSHLTEKLKNTPGAVAWWRPWRRGRGSAWRLKTQTCATRVRARKSSLR